MSDIPHLDELAERWVADPTTRLFAPLADALRKAGSLVQAEEVASTGVRAIPDYVPGRIVLAKVLSDGGDVVGARRELTQALALDPDNPVVVELLEQFAPANRAEVHRAATPTVEERTTRLDASRAPTVQRPEFRDHKPFDATPDDEPVMTESMAALYERQGHLDQALEVLEALALRRPDNDGLVARRDDLRRAIAAAKPIATVTDGAVPVRSWLARVAAAGSEPAINRSSFDEFFGGSAIPKGEDSDLAEFQAWLRELER